MLESIVTKNNVLINSFTQDNQQFYPVMDGNVKVNGKLTIHVSSNAEDAGDLLNKEFITIPLTNKQEIDLAIENYSIAWINDDEDGSNRAFGLIELDVSMQIECEPEIAIDAANYMLSEFTEDLRWVCGVSNDKRFVRYGVQAVEINWNDTMEK